MEIRKLRLLGKDYTLTLNRCAQQGWEVALVPDVHDKGHMLPCRVVHWCSQRNVGHEGIVQDMLVFTLGDVIYKVIIVEQRCDGEISYHVHLINDGKIISVTPTPMPRVHSFAPARCSIDVEPVAVHQDLVLKSPLAGVVVKIKASIGQFVEKNQPLVVIDSMKMENEICAPFAAFIKTLSISEGNLVKPNQVIVTFERRGGDKNATTKSSDGQAIF